MKRNRIIWLAGAWIALGCAVVHADVPIQTLSDGIALTLGSEQVELRVASPHAFRLHVFTGPEVERVPSLYLSGATQPETPFTVVHEASAVGIKTDFGELLVDPDHEAWSLRDSAGATLTAWVELNESAGQVGARPTVQLVAGASPNFGQSRFYGSGNVPDRGALIQYAVTAKTGNGTAGLPQYWSNGGYGALMVGANDRAPAAWAIDARADIVWSVPGNEADLYLMPARNLYDWLRADAELTGFAPVPPRWAFGFFQSRWGWESKAYIDDTFAHFRKDELPVDTFILDFEWYTTKPDYGVPPEGDLAFVDFGWNPALLPDPAKQIADFAQQGLHIVGIRKPRLGNTDNLVMARSKGWILSLNPDDPNGGSSRTRDLDFSQAAVRSWWKDNNRKFLDAGMAAFWNDEGETNYTEYAYWNMAEIDLFKQINPDARFWSLNRSFIPGMQRLGVTAWTGDIQADWGTLARTPGELLSYSLSGLPYSTCDIGGFSGNTTPELLTRWMQAGIFFPVMRSHSEVGSMPHFPWLYGPEAEAAMRKALDLRYQLIPYYYSLAHESYRTGAPLMRPLVMEFPDDPQVAGMTNEWLMGKGLLAAPILNQGGTRSAYLPKGRWFAFDKLQSFAGAQMVKITAKLDEIPAFVRAGTLLPLGPVLQYTGQATDAPLELQIYPGADATFDLVEDDGQTLDYQTGNTRTTTFSWNDQTKTLSWNMAGDYQGANIFHSVKAVLFSSRKRREATQTLDPTGSISFK
jgi:alpha-glucosidase